MQNPTSDVLSWDTVPGKKGLRVELLARVFCNLIHPYLFVEGTGCVENNCSFLICILSTHPVFVAFLKFNVVNVFFSY